MFSWSTRRKLFYLSLFFAFVLFVIALPSFFVLYTPPSCSDKKQNQGEFGVDCGGPCSLLCPSETLAPIVLWKRAFPVAPGVYNTVAFIENPNVKSAVTTAPYVFRLYDADNTLIVERHGTTRIEPRKTFYVFEGVVLTGNRIPVRTEFEFIEPLTWHSETPQDISVIVSGQQFMELDTSPRVTAIIANKGNDTLFNLHIVAIISDELGNAIAASKTVIDFLAKDEQKPLVFTWRLPWGTTTPAKVDFGVEALGQVQ